MYFGLRVPPFFMTLGRSMSFRYGRGLLILPAGVLKILDVLSTVEV